MIKEKYMYKQSLKAISCSTIALICGFAVSQPVAAKCGCPDDGHGMPKLAIGLGEAFPNAPDLAPHPAWAVYEFERDGIRYVQMNDQAGIVRAAVGRIDNTFWVMPLGTDVERVSLPDDAWPIGQGTVLVSNGDLEVVVYVNAGVASWRVRAP
jgi:hypothetical protein